MASTNKTPNLELPQWEAADSVERTDMNSAFAKLDAAVSAVDGEALKLYKLVETTVPASNLGTFSIDLGGINLGEYKFLFLYTPHIRESDVHFGKSNTVGKVSEGAYALGFPMGSAVTGTRFITAMSTDVKTSNSTAKFSSVKELYFVALGSGAVYNTASTVYMWGVK